jgi:hypothetical protein
VPIPFSFFPSQPPLVTDRNDQQWLL